MLLAGRIAWRIADRSWAAAIVAATSVALCAGWWWHAAVGNGEGLFLALVLAAVDQALNDRHDRALALAVLAALLRPESWPFLALYGLWLWRSDPRLRTWLAAAAVAILALWFLPELWGSGDLLRSSERARIPNPGAPATKSFPAWESLRTALAIPFAPVLALALLSRRWLVVAPGLAWIALVAIMAEGGYSGEARYALPGAALLAVAAGAGAARLPARWLAVAAIVAIPFAVVRIDGVTGELGRSADDAALWSSLGPALEGAGGARRALSCGSPATGRYRGTGVAYALGVHKRQVRADGLAPGGLALRSRVRPSAAVSPRSPPESSVLSKSARWELRCGVRTP